MLLISIFYVHRRLAHPLNQLPVLFTSNLDLDFEGRKPMFRNVHVYRIDFVGWVLNEVETVQEASRCDPYVCVTYMIASAHSSTYSKTLAVQYRK